MGLNVKDIQLRLCKVVQLSSESSYTFLQKHPLVSGALLVCFILYIFLSYIYSFFVYMSPFLLCGAIFIRIFWSSEQTQLRYVKKEKEKGEQKRVETKCPEIPNNGRQLLYKYPSQNATSRRRNFTGKKWDVYGGLEEKAKDLSAVFHNEFTKRTTEKGESSLNYGLSAKRFQAPKRQTLRSEPSMVDLVEYGGSEIDSEKMENGDDEDEEEAQEDRNKAIEWTEDDQKNLMDLGVSEMERNRRLEILIARRRARKLLKPHLYNGLNDKKSITRSHIAPVLTRRGNLFDSPKDFEGFDDLEMPGSAPSMIPKSPYDIPYDPSEEKPNLTGDSFLQEFTCQQKDMPFCRHESFSLGPLFPSETKQDHEVREPYSSNNGRNRPAYSRFRRIHADKGNHDWLIDTLNYNEGGESGLQAPNSLRKGEETTQEEDGKCKADMAEVKDEKVENAHETKSMSDQASDPSLVPNISNVPTARVPRFPTPHEKLLKLPFPTTTNESMLDTIPSLADKRQENMFLTDRRLCHTPTYSIASDLQVEVSDVGSLASTVDEVGETNSSTDRESVEYDGDIDRDVSSGSEELWGASFHGRGEAHGVRNEEEIAEVNNNSKDIVSTLLTLRQIDEENVADVSSLSSRSDMPEDTPTCAINSAHNIFGYMKYTVGETEAPQSSLSSYTVDQFPNEIQSEQPEEWSNMSENLINEAHVTNDVNNSAATEQDNTENSRTNEDPGISVVRQESIDESSIHSISSSPRSVLPEKTIADGITSSAYDQEMNIDAEQSNMEDMTQETLNGERPPDILPQNIQSLMDDTNDESQNVDLNHSREQANPPENSTEESNMFGKLNGEEICDKEEQDKLKNDENSEDSSRHLIRQEATAESTTLINERTTMEVMNEKPRDSVNDKHTELVEGDKSDQPENSNIHENLPQPRVTEPIIPSKEANEGHAEDS
ncbi:uncharacterized protein LOC133302300 [Gastrolobium bilobum]|uniref:uncharacterized protein LOC133302300 n=1 Tax=Gastrolobium bilobum TaxID=150636 RepID=UPI002AB058BF|nr:uncharacterized protein LOC133302300 [Gastrolobium bilobum]